MKTCFKCRVCQPLDAFYKHKQMADGHLNKCKACTKSDVWHHRRENLERIREYDRARGKLAHRIADATRRMAEYREKYPERYAAAAAVARAVRSGKLQKLPCFMCGDLNVEAHHPDYSAPLAVVWLCASDHKAIHLAFPDDHYTKMT